MHSNLPGKRREVYFEESIYIKELRNIQCWSEQVISYRI
jgi:hypothetical protein